MYLVSCALAVAVAVVALARRRRPLPARRPCGSTLPPVLARIHYELLAARAELRDAIGMPFARSIDLRAVDLRRSDVGGARPGTCCDADDGEPPLGWHDEDEDVIGASRARLAQLWRRHGEVLGSSLDPQWHLHGRVDWFRLGPLGRQVVHLRATSGHDAGRWVAIRVHRRAGRASFGIGGGGFPIGGTVRAADRDELLEVVRAALSGSELVPSWTGARGSCLVADRHRAGRGVGRWQLTDVVEVASYGWMDPLPSRAVVGPGPDGLAS